MSPCGEPCAEWEAEVGGGVCVCVVPAWGRWWRAAVGCPGEAPPFLGLLRGCTAGTVGCPGGFQRFRVTPWFLRGGLC